MSAGRVNLLITQGETFDKRFEYKDSNGLPIDLSYYHAKMQIRPAPESSVIYATISSSYSADGTGITFTPLSGSSVLPPSSGSFRIQISAYSSSLFSFKEAVADLFLYSGSGVTQIADKVLDFKIKIQTSVTR